MQWNTIGPGTVYAGVRIKGAAVRRKKEAPADTNDFLYHYGITGMHWGERRYQNEDGSYTEEGKIRYNKSKPESETWKKSDAEHLSDEELRRRNNRLQAERQYKDLTTSQVERERAQRRKEIINKVLIGTAVSLAAVAMRGHYKQALSFIGKYGKRAVAKLRASSGIKAVMKSVSGKYSHPHGSRGMLGLAGNRLNRSNRLFNYRPRINNSIPRTNNFPNSPIETLGKFVRKVRT